MLVGKALRLITNRMDDERFAFWLIVIPLLLLILSIVSLAYYG